MPQHKSHFVLISISTRSSLVGARTAGESRVGRALHSNCQRRNSFGNLRRKFILITISHELRLIILVSIAKSEQGDESFHLSAHIYALASTRHCPIFKFNNVANLRNKSHFACRCHVFTPHRQKCSQPRRFRSADVIPIVTQRRIFFGNSQLTGHD